MGKIYLYPVWIRLWHTVNAILILLLIITGLSLQYSSPDFKLIRFDVSVSIHNVSGIILLINYAIIVFGNIFTKNGKFYRFKWNRIGGQMTEQLRYYLKGIFKGENPPFPITEKRKFNPLQKISYVLVIYFFMPLIFITGVALMFPELIIVKKIFGTSGIHFTDLIHIIVGFVLSMFLVIHIYLCFVVKPSGSSFKAMLTGWHHAEE
jgi:thiosulfate reductase cytochrome b subunit